MNYKNVNDYELLYMIADGEEKYLELLLEKYHFVIQQQVWKWKAIFNKLGVEAEDLQQEISCAIVLSVRNYDLQLDTCLYTYLINVIENKMKNLLRFYQNEKNQVLNRAISLSTPVQDTGMILQDLIEDYSEDMESIIDISKKTKDIYQYCYHLSFENAQIFELYLNGYKVSHITKLLGISQKQISNVLFQIRKKIRLYLFEDKALE